MHADAQRPVGGIRLWLPRRRARLAASPVAGVASRQFGMRLEGTNSPSRRQSLTDLQGVEVDIGADVEKHRVRSYKAEQDLMVVFFIAATAQ